MFGTRTVAFAAGVYVSEDEAARALAANEEVSGHEEIAGCIARVGGTLLPPDLSAIDSSTFRFTLPQLGGGEQTFELHYFQEGEIFAAVSLVVHDPALETAIPTIVSTFASRVRARRPLN